MHSVELQHAKERKFHREHSVTYETTNCYTFKRNKNLFARIGKLFTIPLIPIWPTHIAYLQFILRVKSFIIQKSVVYRMVTNWLNDTISSHVKIWLISSHVKTSMISLLSSLSLNLYLNLLVYHRNIFGSSSKVFGNLRKFSKILRICSGTLVWSLEQFWKIFGNLREVVGNLRKIIKNAVISMFK